MQLNIYELNENHGEGIENNELMESSFEQIPENIVPIKKKVPQSILKKNIRQQMHPLQNPSPLQKPKISYEDILSKMGMFVSDGKLHLVDKNSVSFQEQEQKQNKTQVVKNIPENQVIKNSYIHNKYFKNELQPQNTIAPPKTLQEYKKRVLENYIERLRIKQIKSRKLLMPTSNISMATGNSSNLNRFFRLN
jgi:hypothetical protein